MDNISEQPVEQIGSLVASSRSLHQRRYALVHHKASRTCYLGGCDLIAIKRTQYKLAMGGDGREIGVSGTPGSATSCARPFTRTA